MSDPTGRMEAIKKRLVVMIETGLGNIGTVSPEWLPETRDFRNLPFVSVKLDDVGLVDLTYGQKTPQDGIFQHFTFSAYIWASNCKAAGEAENRYAHQHADDIIDYLKSRRNLESANGILDITELGARELESDLLGLSRILVEGLIFSRRVDS